MRSASSIDRFVRLTAFFCAFCAVYACFGGVDETWTCETSEISEHGITAYHGESVEMRCQMLNHGRVVSGCGTAEFLWQTNGMGTAWWTTNASFSAGYVKRMWTPEFDSGASSYRFFFRVTDTKGANYRANGTIDLLGSPYGNARYVPIPAKILDFAKVEVLNATNAPWAMKTNAVPVYVETDPTVGLTNDTVYASGTNRTFLTEHQSLSFTNDYRRVAEKIDWTDVTNHADFVTESITNGLATVAGVAENYVELKGNPGGNKTAITIGSRSSRANVGQYSAAFGNEVMATEKYSLAEGNRTHAYGQSSHAEGDKTYAIGYGSHAEGLSTTAAGHYAHSEGDTTVASGRVSHASGVYAVAEHDRSFVWNGSNNVTYSSKSEGSFNINPVGGVSGFFVGSMPLDWHMTNSVSGMVDARISAATNAVRRITDGVHEIKANGEFEYGDVNQPWTPGHTPIHENPQEGDEYYRSVEWGIDELVWTCAVVLWDGYGWYEMYDTDMGGDYTNQNATVLTFPDGTVTRRMVQTRLATTNDVERAATNIVSLIGMNEDDVYYKIMADGYASIKHAVYGTPMTGFVLVQDSSGVVDLGYDSMINFNNGYIDYTEERSDGGDIGIISSAGVFVTASKDDGGFTYNGKEVATVEDVVSSTNALPVKGFVRIEDAVGPVLKFEQGSVSVYTNGVKAGTLQFTPTN